MATPGNPNSADVHMKAKLDVSKQTHSQLMCALWYCGHDKPQATYHLPDHRHLGRILCQHTLTSTLRLTPLHPLRCPFCRLPSTLRVQLGLGPPRIALLLPLLPPSGKSSSRQEGRTH